jgi:hypothetical protein
MGLRIAATLYDNSIDGNSEGKETATYEVIKMSLIACEMLFDESILREI